jgi:uncharacterized protein (TIRG00374 family)
MISAFVTKYLGWIGRRWRIVTSVVMSLCIFTVAVLNWEWLSGAFEIAYHADMFWLAAAFGTILLSYLVTSQVLMVALRLLGHSMGVLRLWAVSLVAIVLSQSVPGGGVGSYAFLLGIFRRHGVPSAQATLVASLEAISYVCTMLLVFLFSLLYMAAHGLATGQTSYISAVVALLIVSGVIFLLTRSRSQLAFVLLTVKNAIAKVLRRSWSDTWVLRKVAELAHARELVASRYQEAIGLMLIQLIGLMGHSLAMLMVFWSLGIQTSYLVVVSAFGIALVTSTFNVLPGGGGTVEAALVAVLVQLGTGSAAVPAAIIFRLFNFWLLMPVAAGSYYWLMHEDPDQSQPVGKKKKAGMRKLSRPIKEH